MNIVNIEMYGSLGIVILCIIDFVWCKNNKGYIIYIINTY